jgi:probable HAF family extracellular repeat protein
MKSTNIVCLLALCLADPAELSVYSAAPEYAFSSMDAPAELGAFTSAYGINNAGVIVGNYVSVDSTLDGFVFQNGRFTPVVVPGVTSDDRGALNDVNDRGQAVGGFTDGETGITYTFIRGKAGDFTLLPDAAPGALLTEATGLNNSGTVVGFYLDADAHRHGFILQNGTYTTYDYPGALRTILTRINNRGQMTGIWVGTDLQRHGFLLQDGVATSIDVPGAVNTRTGGINNLGDIVGYYDDADFVSHGYLLKDGVFTTLDFPGAFDTTLLDINDHGVIAGTFDGFSRGLVATPVQQAPGNAAFRD